ncbi:transthyretin-like family domain-containing protein [Ditylenchus destructor]|uniref:Transthyretin-like family domain-containing protein n=1 Tax=Ditylenchus destructor TaxID=166010 RepID=A0AAD4N6D8_9BILA|nr:transthyretin-like family domain-containing protein [Ditylenchus destructor]
MKIALCIVIAVAAFTQECYAGYHNITATGFLECNKTPVVNATVELREHDILDPDDSKYSTTSDITGHFNVHGDEDEMGKVEFYIRIVHTCDAKENCQRQSDYEIPNSKLDNVYEMGTLNLMVRGKDEKDLC